MSTSAPAAIRRKDDGLGRRTASAISLTFLTSTSGRVLTMATTFVLARLLSPHDFGIANLSSVLLAVVLPLTDIGIAQGLISGAEDDLSATARTAFWLVIALGGGLYALGAGLSGVIAQFFGEPDLGPVLVVTNLSIVVYATSRIPSALLERELLYSRKVMPEVVGSIAYSVIAIVLAFLKFGYWSIVIATVARSAIISAGLFVITRWRPGISFDVKVARELISYARVLFASSMLRLAYTNVDNMIVGKVLGVTALGYYAMAYNLGNLLATQIAGAVGTGLFPAYSRMLPDKERVRKTMLTILRYTGLAITPLTICGIITVPYLIPIVIGPKWVPMTTALQVILIYGWLRTVAPIYWTLMLVEDMRRDTLLINLVSLAVALAVAYPVVTRWGFVGIAVEFTLLEVVRTIWMAVAIRIRLKAGYLSQLAQLWPGFAASAIVGALLVAALNAPIATSTILLFAEIAVAGALYLGLLFLFGEVGRKQLMMAGSMLQKRGA